MKCAGFEPRVALYAGGELDEASASALESHVATCADCRALLADLSGRRDMMADWRVAEPSEASLDDVRRRVLATIARGDVRRSLWDRVWSISPSDPAWRMAGVGVAAVVLVACAVWWFVARPPQGANPAPQIAANAGRAPLSGATGSATTTAGKPTVSIEAIAARGPERDTSGTRSAARRSPTGPERSTTGTARAVGLTGLAAGIGTVVARSAPGVGVGVGVGARRIEFQTADPHVRIIWLLPGPAHDANRTTEPGR